MKWLTFALLAFSGFLITGCVHETTAARPAVPKAAPLIVTPDSSVSGKVVSYNSFGRFVVVNFPSHQMPKLDQQLFLYRNGLKIAQIKITGPQNEDNIVADLMTGDAQIGDEVRDQ